MRKPVKKSMLTILLTLCSCTPLTPDTFTIGFSNRPLSGNYGPFPIKKTIPLYRIEAHTHFNQTTSIYAHGDFIQGSVPSHPYGIDSTLEGNATALGAGLRHDLTKHLYFDAGTDVIFGTYTIHSQFFPLTHTVNGNYFGTEFHAGLGITIPLTEKINLIAQGGYNHTLSSHATKGNFSLNGLTTYIGIEIPFP